MSRDFCNNLKIYFSGQKKKGLDIVGALLVNNKIWLFTERCFFLLSDRSPAVSVLYTLEGCLVFCPLFCLRLFSAQLLRLHLIVQLFISVTKRRIGVKGEGFSKFVYAILLASMGLISIILIALSLSADCFAVAVGSSAASIKLSRLREIRVAAAFGFFQFLMPVIGWLAGKSIIGFISGYDHWIAFGLLAFIGGRLIRESLQKGDKKGETDISRGWLMVTLAIATSIDALAVGLSFALLSINVLQAGMVIGAVAFLVTLGGFWLGRKAGDILGKRAQLVGGLVLIAIGARILISHLVERV